MQRDIVVFDKVVKDYSRQRVLDGVNLKIKEGDFVFLIGASGAGKTTMMNLILKLIEPTRGSITVNGIHIDRLKHKNVYRYRRFLGVVFEDFRLLTDRSVYENVAFAQQVVEVPKAQIEGRVMEVLDLVGLADKADVFPDELSGGEMQRVAIARAVVNRPCLLLADEPTRNLDRGNAIQVMRMIEKINRMGTTVVVATHNPEIVNSMKKRVITLEDGVIINDSNPGRYFYGLPEEIYSLSKA